MFEPNLQIAVGIASILCLFGELFYTIILHKLSFSLFLNDISPVLVHSAIKSTVLVIKNGSQKAYSSAFSLTISEIQIEIRFAFLLATNMP
jgi:hypothetical protein